MIRTWLFIPALACGAFAAFASCATSTNDGAQQEDASSSVPTIDSAVADVLEASVSMISCESVDWCGVPTPLSPRYTFTSVWGTSKTDVWAVGSGGTIFHYDGQVWIPTQSESLVTFSDVWGSGPNDVWVVSSAATILHSTGFANGTAAWTNHPITTSTTAQSIPDQFRVHAIWGTGPDDVRIGTDFHPHVIVQSPDDARFVFWGSSNQFLRSSLPDGNVLWRVIPSKAPMVKSIWGSSAIDVWMTTDDTSDAGQGALTLHGTQYTGPRPHPAALTEGFTCASCGFNCKGCAVLDDPLVWTVVDSQSQVTLESVWGSSADDVWAVGRRGTIRRIRAGDERWQVVESPTTETLHRVWGSGPNDVWMVGDNGTILHFDGATITPSTAQLPSGPRPSLRGVWGSGPDDVWIVGDGIALHYTGPKVAP